MMIITKLVGLQGLEGVRRNKASLHLFTGAAVPGTLGTLGRGGREQGERDISVTQQTKRRGQRPNYPISRMAHFTQKT